MILVHRTAANELFVTLPLPAYVPDLDPLLDALEEAWEAEHGTEAHRLLLDVIVQGGIRHLTITAKGVL